tara:strand:+ start:169 stop:369 length:201 start_codon:yes stop_codon:yes gene_type:complete
LLLVLVDQPRHSLQTQLAELVVHLISVTLPPQAVVVGEVPLLVRLTVVTAVPVVVQVRALVLTVLA